MANIITTLALEMNANWYVTKKLNSVGRVGENTVTKLIIEPTEILDNVTYEIEIADASGSKNVAELTVNGTELYLILTANMLTTSGIMKMQVRGLFTDGSIKKSNIFELKVNRSISATEHYEEYAVTIFDQLVQDCRDIIEGAESYAIRAETAAVNAEAYEQSASASAEAASTSEATASTASTAAVNAAASAESASASATASAETATTAATSASTSAANASTSAQSAQTAANTATTASETAVNASNTATSAATSAESSATSATTAANNASASATAASTSATNAAISETNASTSATNASTSETNAASSATSAANSATSASTSATNAANSATAAATSATSAHTSEVNASTSETNASTSATEAAASAESIAASVAQINENTYRINDLEAIIAGYQLTDLPTGAIATITDGTALLMPSLKVGIEPVQDLHGYDHPWAGGAGKNKCNAQNPIVLSQADNIGNQSCVISAGTYTYSWTSSENTAISLTLWNDSTQIGTFASTTAIHGRGNITFTITENATHLRCYYNGATTISDIQVEEGSTATSYEPYSNICPISGWTAANVMRSGKNLFDESILLECDGWTVSNGIYSGSSGRLFNKYGAGVPNLAFKQNTRYTFSFTYGQEDATGAGFVFVFRYTDNTMSVLYGTLETVGFLSITSSAGKSIKGIELSYAVNRTIYLSNMQLEEGSTATTYEPYNGTTYTIQFTDGDNPLTVYDGTLDVTTGELVVDRASVDLGTIRADAWSRYTPDATNVPVFFATVSGILPNSFIKNKCSIYECLQWQQLGERTDFSLCVHPTLPMIYIADSRYTTINDFAVAMNGVQLVYELATPVTYHLTPTQVRTLVGNNNIWADTGDIIEGKYFRSLS